MYQSLLLRQTRLAAVFTLVGLGAGVGAANAADQKTIDGCVRALIKNAAKYEATRIKSRQKCQDALLKGKVPSCPDAKETDKIAKADAKFRAAVTKKCTDEAVTLSEMGWEDLVGRCTGGSRDGELCYTANGDGDCPDIDDGTCDVGGSNTCDGGVNVGDPCTDDADCLGSDGSCIAATECPPINNDNPASIDAGVVLTGPDDVAECLIEAGNAGTDAILDLAFGHLRPNQTGDKAILNCQRTLGKELAKAYGSVRKSMQKCQDAIIKGKFAGPCPDAKTGDKIAKALGKIAPKLASKCPSAVAASSFEIGKLYRGLGRWRDFTGYWLPVEVFPGDPLENLACNVVGLGQHLDAAALGSNFGGGFDALRPDCGNGQIDAGETCDDGDRQNDDGVSAQADTCPADCVVGPCTDAGNQQITVNFTSPENLTGLQILLAYDDTKVAIPGSANSGPVVAAVGSTTFNVANVNDLNYAIRVVLADPDIGTTGGVPSGAAFTIQMDTCQGAPAPAPADFVCTVVASSGLAFTSVPGVTCNVSVP
jgi:cysteine-rich repeat protein